MTLGVAHAEHAAAPAIPSARSRALDASSVPTVMLLDLDGTVVGRVNALVCEYELTRQQAMQTSVVQGPAAATISKGPSSSSSMSLPAALTRLKASFVSRLKWGIIRPHLDTFCKAAASASASSGGKSGVELFVYTASTPAWANYLVPCIETTLGVRFNRPILTRDHCVVVDAQGVVRGSASQDTVLDGNSTVAAGEIRKSIAGVLPLVVRALRKRYPALKTPADLKGRVVLIDNTPHVLARRSEDAMLIKCPTYDYLYAYDVLGGMSVDTLHRDFHKLAPTLRAYGIMHPISQQQRQQHQALGVVAGRGDGAVHRTFQQFAADYYAQLAKTMRRAQDENARALGNDQFWLRLTYALFGGSGSGAGSGAPTRTDTANGPFSPERVRWIQKRVTPGQPANKPTSSAKRGG